MHPLALAESGWVWVGAGSRPAGLRTGRAIPGLRRDAALPVLVPGDPESAARAKRLREGIPIPQSLSEKLKPICQRAGVPFLLE